MATLRSVLLEYELLLKELNAPVTLFLQNGLEESYIQSLLSPIDKNFPSLIDLYRWKNGVVDFNASIQQLELFPDGIMLSLENAVECYQIYVASKQRWQKELFPIFTNGGGDYLLLNCSEESVNQGRIFLYAPSFLLSEALESIYDSLETLFHTNLSCFKKRAYFVNSENKEFEVSYDEKYEISGRLNPKASFWKSDKII